jgi:hypothetical protein
MKKFCFNGQMRIEPFLIVIYHSTMVKGAMNAARVCKLRTGVKKTPRDRDREFLKLRSISLDSTFKGHESQRKV